MDNTFNTWDDFVKNFGREMREAGELYEQMVNNGCKDLAVASFDMHFDSDEKEKLVELSEHLAESYGYQMHEIEYMEDEQVWELSGSGAEVPVTEDTLIYWVLDMAKCAYEFDAKLTGYGAETADESAIPELSAERETEYFDKGMAAYDAGNRSGALFQWTLAILCNPDNPDSYFSRAIVKNELHTWKAALKDYDEAIRLAPDYLAAILNRGTLKDENGDAAGAFADYNNVIANAGDDAEQLALAYFNRGNTKHRTDDHQGACEDWKKAKELGADYADERIEEFCKKH